MSDDELIDRFERVAFDGFRHVDHIHVAWAYLERDGPEAAQKHLAAGLQRFAAAKGHPEKYHETLTRAWLQLIDVARHDHPEAHTAAELLTACPELADPRMIRRYYSDATLESAAARTGWVRPDLRAFAPTI